MYIYIYRIYVYKYICCYLLRRITRIKKVAYLISLFLLLRQKTLAPPYIFHTKLSTFSEYHVTNHLEEGIVRFN